MTNKNSNTTSRLYEKWTDLKEQSRTDCSAINISNLQQDFNLAGLNMKWLGYFQDWQRVFISLEIKRKQIKRELTEYYKVESNLRLDTKDEMSLFIETDDRYVHLLEQTQIVKSMLIFCETVMDKLRGKSFEVKNWIDWSKFQSGA